MPVEHEDRTPDLQPQERVEMESCTIMSGNINPINNTSHLLVYSIHSDTPAILEKVVFISGKNRVCSAGFNAPSYEAVQASVQNLQVT